MNKIYNLNQDKALALKCEEIEECVVRMKHSFFDSNFIGLDAVLVNITNAINAFRRGEAYSEHIYSAISNAFVMIVNRYNINFHKKEEKELTESMIFEISEDESINEVATKCRTFSQDVTKFLNFERLFEKPYLQIDIKKNLDDYSFEELMKSALRIIMILFLVFDSFMLYVRNYKYYGALCNKVESLKFLEEKLGSSFIDEFMTTDVFLSEYFEL